MKSIVKPKKRSSIAVGVVVLFFLFILFKVVYTALHNNVTTSSVSVSEYDSLFTKQSRSNLKLLGTENGRNRQATSNYEYDRRFGILVYKVLLSNKSELKNVINCSNETSGILFYSNPVYTKIGGYNYEMYMSAGKSIPVSSLTLKCTGDSIKVIIKNDSLYCYYYKFKTFSIHYNDEPYDIIAKANHQSIPSSAAFEKKGKFLYVILMTIEDGTEEMPPDLLNTILKK